jgi:hypothetical protein
MVDITKVQLNPIPPTILELQEQNSLLQGKKKYLKKSFLD